MHLLYLDDSGSSRNADDRHVILAGLAAFERKPYYLSNKLDEIALRVWPDNSRNFEFRGADIYAGRHHWRGVGREDRLRAYRDALRVLADEKQVRIFGAVIHKAALAAHAREEPADPMEFAFEHMSNRFDRMLRRLFLANDIQRGLIVLDESSYETSLQALAKNFRGEGHRWGVLRYMADVPLFVNSKATRMIQYADLIAYALRRYYEKGDSSLFDIFKHRIDAEGGVLHGLVHFKPAEEQCNCHVCRRR